MTDTVRTAAGRLTIRDDHPGGNATDVAARGSTVHLAPDRRDATERWLYWNVDVESAADGPVQFHLPDPQLVGPWGPAVRRTDGEWRWLGADARVAPTGFEYRFEPDERVRFAFSLPYQRADLNAFRAAHADDGLEQSALTTTRRGREVPLLRAGNPDVEAHVLFACRHHACESPASYVLEGLLSALLDDHAAFLDAHRVHAVPLVDVDGVERGDQGKYRAPHDHNRDYSLGNALLDDVDSLYRSTAAIREYVRDLDGDVHLALDLHCPWVEGRPHDRPFFVADPDDVPAPLESLAERLERRTGNRSSADGLVYRASPGIGLASPGGPPDLPAFEDYCRAVGADLSATLEVPYFGRPDARVTPASCRQFGADVAAAIALERTQGAGGSPS